jgi:hypothetical protein
MLTASKWLLIIAGFWLIVDAILITGGITQPTFWLAITLSCDSTIAWFRNSPFWN